MKTELLKESSPKNLTLTAIQASQLRLLGGLLRSQKPKPGYINNTDDTEDTDDSERSAVGVEQLSSTTYKVTVFNAIGAIGLGDLQLVVEPKIPVAHLLYLLGESHEVPQAASGRVNLDVDVAFTTLIMRWFVEASEQLLRRGLDRDYQLITANLAFARGKVHALPTARSILAGRPVIRCEFDEFTEDTSLNRVLKAAARHVLASPQLPIDLRRRCRSVYQRIEAPTEIRGHDLEMVPDSRSRHYRDAHQLALLILRSGGIAPAAGTQAAWTLLIKTPTAAEEGIRNTLKRHLEPTWKVRKKGKKLIGTRARTLHPDLVFGDDNAVGDVKYMVTNNGEIGRSHLNQVTTFAVGYQATKAIVVAFGHDTRGEQVNVGDVHVQGINWDTSQDPERAADKLADQVLAWLSQP